MSFATTGMDFQGIIINEIRQRKTKLGAICLTSGINKAKFIERKSDAWNSGVRKMWKY